MGHDGRNAVAPKRNDFIFEELKSLKDEIVPVACCSFSPPSRPPP